MTKGKLQMFVEELSILIEKYKELEVLRYNDFIGVLEMAKLELWQDCLRDE